MKSKKNYRLFCILFIILTFVAAVGAYRVYYRPFDRQIKKVETDIVKKEAEYKDYLSAKWEPKIWKKTVESANTLNGSDKMPKSMQEQDQIIFVASLEKKLGFYASDIKIGKSSPVAGTNVMSKELSFSYRVSSYDELCGLINAICHDETFPSSVIDFTMDPEDNGAFRGIMNVRNYYDPQNGDPIAAGAYSGISSGMERLFINE